MDQGVNMRGHPRLREKASSLFCQKIAFVLFCKFIELVNQHKGFFVYVKSVEFFYDISGDSNCHSIFHIKALPSTLFFSF